MMATCGQIVGLILLVTTNLAIIIGFATPYWVEYHTVYKQNQGLWATCHNEDCTWVFDDDFSSQRSRPDWFKATQGCMSVGLGLGLIALLIATLSLCCTCHSCNPNAPICALLIVACLAMGVGVVIFGIKAKNDWGIELSWNRSIIGSLAGGGRFGWSYWVSIGAAGLALLTSAIYGCIGRKTDY